MTIRRALSLATESFRSVAWVKHTPSPTPPPNAINRDAVESDAKAERSSYYLSKDTYFCMTDNHYVFLDLRRDKYLCLTQAHSAAIQPVLGAESTKYAVSDEGKKVLHSLAQAGLLVSDPAFGRPPPLPRIDLPTESLIPNSWRRSPTIGSTDIWRFVSATTDASMSLGSRSIQWTVHGVGNRRSAVATGHPKVDEEMLGELFRKFQKLRPFYPRPYLCLFDSLALLNFLGPYGAFPHWIYGVKLKPFAAHCWVQHANLVVNDVVEKVREYTPVMRV
jgi:hypothetical protein